MYMNYILLNKLLILFEFLALFLLVMSYIVDKKQIIRSSHLNIQSGILPDPHLTAL